MRRRLLGLALLAAALLLAMAADVLSGPAALGPAELWQAVWQPGQVSELTRVIVWDLRLPHAGMALAVGLALGLAGAEMQTVLDNPLASPFTLGVASAAALGAALAIVLGWTLPGVPDAWAEWAVVLNAFVFALGAALLLDLLARWGGLSTTGLILFGIALVFSFNAVLSLVQYAASAQALQGLVFWTMGSLERASWPVVAVLLLAVALTLPWSLRDAHPLTALRLGEARAASFGIHVAHLRLRALLRISLLAALAVAFAGTIGFVGLMAPHMARLLLGEDQRYYLPGSALLGGLVLTLAALASKSLVPGLILPIGIVTSLVGVPFFLLVLWRRPL
ncbi:FecCD family ABC transporter permease [Castellaniella sp.]|uniref:FecCD family ABC transporter permease n=1 Tax=Castellaniella sp. TaxID=1955812 RepID=UPI0035632972